MMGEMLTYRDSKSTAYLFDYKDRLGFADENYSREIMQVRLRPTVCQRMDNV